MPLFHLSGCDIYVVRERELQRQRELNWAKIHGIAKINPQVCLMCGMRYRHGLVTVYRRVAVLLIIVFLFAAYNSDLSGRRLSFGLQQRSLSAAFYHLKDVRCETNLQQLWRRVFLQLKVRTCGTAFQLNCDKPTLAFSDLNSN